MLFALLFGLGIIVDDAIVVIENTHRIFTQSKGKLTSTIAAKMAAGEVFVPVLAGTLTTLAPFFPLLFWPGIIGKFMIYLPAMLIFTLTASLIVAFLMNPVFAVDFMNHEEDGKKPAKSAIFKKPFFWILFGLGILFDVAAFGYSAIAQNALSQKLSEIATEAQSASGSLFFIGNLLLLFAILMVLNKYLFDGWIHAFQNRALPWIMSHYENLLKWALKGRRPVGLLLGTVVLLIISIAAFFSSVGSGRIQVEFFPSGAPNQIYVYLRLPVGTSVDYTDSITKTLETKVYHVLGMDNGKKNPVVESVISNIAIGANDPTSGDQSTHPERGRIQVSFVEYAARNGIQTQPYLDSMRAELKGIPGAEISVAKENNGPPTDPPVNIEIASDDFDDLTKTAISLKNYLDSIQVPGVEELKMDVDLTNPEITFNIDREKANAQGVSTYQIGNEIRTAVFGREVSKIKEGKDEYKIQLRDEEMDKMNLADLLNMNITFRNSTGHVKSVPLGSLVDVDYTSTLGSVKRKHYKRVITLTSNLLSNYTATTVNQQLATYIQNFKQKPDDVTVAQAGGESEQQAETGAFLGQALLIALGLILLILVLQFNSVGKSVIILTEIVFSVIGVLLGFTLTGMNVSVVMTGLGIVGLAGIVVKNGILVIEFADELRSRGLKTREAVIEAGKTRIIPVLLTALAAILALIPLAVGFNINFITLFSDLNPHIYFGGDNTVFWKPLAWTIIFGLAFAFFMTLVIVPSMYLIAERLRRPMRRMYGGKWISMMGIPPLTFLFIPLILVSTYVQRRKVSKRRRRADPKTTNEAFVGSWF